jgi:hypothetical protein
VSRRLRSWLGRNHLRRVPVKRRRIIGGLDFAREIAEPLGSLGVGQRRLLGWHEITQMIAGGDIS